MTNFAMFPPENIWDHERSEPERKRREMTVRWGMTGEKDWYDERIHFGQNSTFVFRPLFEFLQRKVAFTQILAGNVRDLVLQLLMCQTIASRRV